MLSNAERVEELHRRMSAIRHRKERRLTGAMGVASVSLFATLIVMLRSIGISQLGTMGHMYAGSTLLFGEAGGYVLTAIVSFVVGTVISVACIKSKKQGSDYEKNYDNPFDNISDNDN